jgi:hypothetical protein
MGTALKLSDPVLRTGTALKLTDPVLRMGKPPKLSDPGYVLEQRLNNPTYFKPGMENAKSIS